VRAERYEQFVDNSLHTEAINGPPHHGLHVFETRKETANLIDHLDFKTNLSKQLPERAEESNLIRPSFDNDLKWSLNLLPVEIDTQAIINVVGLEASETAHPFAPCPRE
jgi:hypothetical protein